MTQSCMLQALDYLESRIEQIGENPMTKTDLVRVVAYLSDNANRVLQAHASLAGIPKQELCARILMEYADTAPLGKSSKRKSKRS